jgi:hypothetical protein
MTTRSYHSARALLAAGSLVIAAACGRGDSGANQDSILARDLALASSVQQTPTTFKDTSLAPAPTPVLTREDESAAEAERARRPSRRPSEPIVRTPRRVIVEQPPVAQPQPAPVVVAPTPAPTPAPAAPAPAHREIGSGASVTLASGSRVCTNSNRAGDKIVATVTSPVSGSNGAMIPAGAAVVLEVASVNSGRSAEEAQIVFRVRSVVIDDKTYDAAADVATLGTLERTRVAGEDPNADKKKVIGGAIAGAILGQIMGKDTKSTVIGAAAGAATGAAVAKAGQRWEGCLPEGSPLRLTLNAPIVIS